MNDDIKQGIAIAIVVLSAFIGILSIIQLTHQVGQNYRDQRIEAAKQGICYDRGWKPCEDNK